MAAEGANVIINYAHDEAAAQEVAAAIAKHDVKSLVVQADIAKPTEIDEMFKKIDEVFSSIDVLVNNAGIFVHGDGPENADVFEEVFATNFFGTIRVTAAAKKRMKKGKIIFISSIHGKLGHGRPSAIAYSSSKAALDSYMKNFAKAVAPDILVNTIAPGRTLTPMWGEMSKSEMDDLAAGQLINRWIDPAEIADSTVFLAQNDAVCGEVLVVDGGMSLRVLG